METRDQTTTGPSGHEKAPLAPLPRRGLSVGQGALVVGVVLVLVVLQIATAWNSADRAHHQELAKAEIVAAALRLEGQAQDLAGAPTGSGAEVKANALALAGMPAADAAVRADAQQLADRVDALAHAQPGQRIAAARGVQTSAFDVTRDAGTGLSTASAASADTHDALTRMLLIATVLMVLAAIAALVVLRKLGRHDFERAYHLLVDEHREREHAEHALRSSEQEFRSLAGSAPVGIFRLDEQGRYAYVNARWREITGIARASVAGGPMSGSFHPEDRPTVEQAWRDGHDDAAGFVVEVRILRPDGDLRWATLRVVPVRDDEGRLVGHVGTLTDVTERRGLIEQLRSRLSEIKAANADLEEARRETERRTRVDALTGLYTRRHFAEVLRAELQRAADAEGGLMPSLLMVDVDHLKRINDMHGGRAGDHVLATIANRIQSAVRSFDTVARWAGEEFSILVPDTDGDDALLVVAEAVRKVVVGAEIELEGGEPVLMTVSIGGARAGQGLWGADGLVDAADRALATAKKRGRNQVLLFGGLSVDDLVDGDGDAFRVAHALVLSASVREGIAESHSQEVADLAAEVGERLGLAPRQIMACRLGGWLHDVGKVAIPDEVLCKPGPLDEAEWVTMKTHTTHGDEIIRRVVGLGDAAPVVRHHHERWDGNGYPDRLRGEQIPIEARVVAAVDAYSAITADRVYRPRRSDREAIAELQRSAGSHLDTAVVTVLCGLLEERLAERDAETAAEPAA